jgi:hypothetical protein
MSHVNRRFTRAAVVAARARSARPGAHASAHQVGSPDAADANRAAAYVDLRSPDARDSGRVVVVSAPAVPAASHDSTGTDWGEIAIAVGAALALAALAAAIALRVRPRTGSLGA